jgi:MoaA/NifB/PqqE/SkfB family radical SAM enzyme
MENIRTIDKTQVKSPARHSPVKPAMVEEKYKTNTVNGFERWWVSVRVKLTVLSIALRCYHSVSKAIRVARSLHAFKRSTYGGNKLRRCVREGNKYYFGIYVPGYPSPLFNRFIATELNRLIKHDLPVNHLQVLQLAITSKCPLRCEHCFEWNNLNKEDSFTTEELKKLITAFQDEGCTEFHFTGGEPLVRMQRLEECIRHASPKSECWVLSSGLGLSRENSVRLKNAGLTGVVISIDHYDAAMHNAFRGYEYAFEHAMNAVKNAHSAKLLTALSICVTQSFINDVNLLRYAELAKACGVSFVQLLEPKAVGHYENKPVSLQEEHTKILDRFYYDINFNPVYRDYPVFIYHGYYQRKTGCLSGGNWVLYIDAAGFIDACPFCHTRNHRAMEIVTGELNVKDINVGGCPRY